MSQENYVVRIYRRGKPKAGDLVGVVEVPGVCRQAVFHDLTELSAILAKPRVHLRHPARAHAKPVSE